MRLDKDIRVFPEKLTSGGSRVLCLFLCVLAGQSADVSGGSAGRLRAFLKLEATIPGGLNFTCFAPPPVAASLHAPTAASLSRKTADDEGISDGGGGEVLSRRLQRYPSAEAVADDWFPVTKVES